MRTGRLMHISSGFTLIELSLSIAFISVLSIIIVVLINGTISSYNRGLTLNKINTGGMDLVDELRTAMQSSKDGSVLDECRKYEENTEAFDNCEKDGAKLFVSVVRRDKVTRGGDTMENIPVYGALCTGNYSYIWNSGYFSNRNDYQIGKGTEIMPVTLKYGDNKTFVPQTGGDDEEGGYVRLLKVEDDRRAVCASKLKDNAYELNWEGNEFNVVGSLAMGSDPEEILASDGHNELAVYYLDTTIPAESKGSKDIFYSVNMILGTTSGGINLSTTGDFCATPGDALENMDFCAVNKFNFAVQVNGL